MRDSFIIYRSFYEAISDLPDKDQAAIWRAICEYSLDFRMPELSGIQRTVFTLIKPQLDANIKRYENGTKPKQKQTGSKTEAKRKQAVSKPEANVNVNDNVNDNVNHNDNLNHNHNDTAYAEVRPTFREFWELYDYKVNRSKAESRWRKVAQKDREAIMEHLARYIPATNKDGTYPTRMHPTTYLTNRRWEDEVTDTKKNGKLSPYEIASNIY